MIQPCVEYVLAEPPVESEVTLAKDKVSGGYASVQLNQGKASLENDKLSGALIGIDVNSYWGEDDSYAPTATASGDKIEGSEATIKGESALAPLACTTRLAPIAVAANVSRPTRCCARDETAATP